jgi:predicted flavoprotein YhiN
MTKKVPGLYFIWEVVDVTWKTGWFNLQWAWSSGYVCGKSFK